jgi:hypothetical protein
MLACFEHCQRNRLASIKDLMVFELATYLLARLRPALTYFETSFNSA